MVQLRWLVLGLIALPFLEFATFFWVAGQIGFLAPSSASCSPPFSASCC